MRNNERIFYIGSCCQSGKYERENLFSYYTCENQEVLYDSKTKKCDMQICEQRLLKKSKKNVAIIIKSYYLRKREVISHLKQMFPSGHQY